jgi:hypothetical protein
LIIVKPCVEKFIKQRLVLKNEKAWQNKNLQSIHTMSAFAEARRSRALQHYKPGFDPSAMKKARQGQQASVRKQKRVENLQKKRNLGTQPPIDETLCQEVRIRFDLSNNSVFLSVLTVLE